MKKLNKITAAFASLALVAAAFTGCVNAHSSLDAMIDLSTFHVRGSCGSWDATDDNKLVLQDEGYYTYSFVAASDKVNFAVDDGTWSVTYRKDASNALLTYSLTEGVTAYPGNDANCPALEGLTVGTNYTVKVTPSSSTVFIEVEEGEATVPAFYIVGNAELTTMTYNGTAYTYDFTAANTTQDLVIYSNGSYFEHLADPDVEKPVKEAIPAYAKDSKDNKATEITTKATVTNVTLSELVAGSDYTVTLTATEGKKKTTYTLIAVKKMPKVYLAGADPLNWSLTDASAAIQMTQIGETANYYYTFTAAGDNLEFKVATKTDWKFAYTNKYKDSTGTLIGDDTVLDAAPVAYDHENAENAKVTGLTKGEKYTILVDLTTETKPMVSVVTGEEVMYAIGNDDFGNWSWDTPKTMSPAGAGLWEYEFTATKAAAEFKFQTACGGWNNDATWSQGGALTVGGDYAAMTNGAGISNTSATLTVGKKYVVSVKKVTAEDDTYTYSVKIAE